MFKSLHFRLQNEHDIETSLGPEQLLPFNLVTRATRKRRCRRADHGTAHEFHRYPLHQAIFGRHLFSLIETKLKTFNPEILEDLQAENKLVSEYMERLSRVRIPFEGEERNLSQMSPYTQSKNRDVRIRAQKAVTSFFLENEAAFDRIFDEMVKTRTLIAKKLGFSSFTALGYARMNRTDYDAAMVAAYRDQVMRTVVPLSQKLRARQAKRLGLESLKYCDEPLEFPTGNATPKGAPDWMIGHAKDMYNEMSPETSEFFNLMQAGGFMDLVAKPGKFPGACYVFIQKQRWIAKARGRIICVFARQVAAFHIWNS